MSCYWRFECLDHDPPIVSYEEFTQHTDDEAFRDGVMAALNRPVHPNGPLIIAGSDDYFAWNAWRFLRDHPTCRLGLLSENDVRRELEATDA